MGKKWYLYYKVAGKGRERIEGPLEKSEASYLWREYRMAFNMSFDPHNGQMSHNRANQTDLWLTTSRTGKVEHGVGI